MQAALPWESFLDSSQEKSQAAFCPTGPVSCNPKSESKLSSGLEGVAEPDHLCKLDLETTQEHILPLPQLKELDKSFNSLLELQVVGGGGRGGVKKKKLSLKKKMNYMVFSPVYS